MKETFRKNIKTQGKEEQKLTQCVAEFHSSILFVHSFKQLILPSVQFKPAQPSKPAMPLSVNTEAVVAAS